MVKTAKILSKYGNKIVDITAGWLRDKHSWRWCRWKCRTGNKRTSGFGRIKTKFSSSPLKLSVHWNETETKTVSKQFQTVLKLFRFSFVSMCGQFYSICLTSSSFSLKDKTASCRSWIFSAPAQRHIFLFTGWPESKPINRIEACQWDCFFPQSKVTVKNCNVITWY